MECSSGVLQTTMEEFTKTQTRMPSSSRRAKQITSALAEFIAKDMRPVSIAEGTGSESSWKWLSLNTRWCRANT